MQNQKKSNPRYLSISIHIILVLMLILPVFSPTGKAQASKLPASSSIDAAVKERMNPQVQPVSGERSGVEGDPLLDENFDYGGTAGNLTAITPNWVAHSGAGTNPIQYAVTSLSMPSYVSSGIGGSATFYLSGEDVNRSFTEQTGSVVYYASLVNLSSATATGDYFMHLKNSTTGFAARLFARDSTGVLQFGIGTSSTPTYGTTTFAYNTTYLVVAKHDQISGESVVYVLDSCSSTEPTTPLASATGTPLASILGIAIRQGTNSPAGTVDGIRVAANWASAAMCGTIPPIVDMTISKSAPDTVDINEAFDYTLAVVNSLGMTATQVVITDSLPISVTIEAVSDGGEILPGNVVSWTVPTIADGGLVNRTVSVAAPSQTGTLVNFDYGVWASNWLTFTMGSPVTTTVINSNAITPIAEARAAGAGWYGTLQGNVSVPSGIYRDNAFVIQDETGGMYIYAGGSTLPPMALGDVIRVKGTLKLYNGLLEIDPLESVEWIDVGTTPAALITTTGNVGNTQGWLVQVLQGTATWSGTPPTPGVSDFSFSYNDGSGAVTVFVDKDTQIDMRGYTSPMFMRLTGFSGNYNAPQIMPRYQNDIVDLSTPSVTATNPADGAVDASPYRPITATFSKAMNPGSLNEATFMLDGPGGPVSGTVGYEDGTHTASFTPAAGLSAYTTYTATLTTGITDIYGIPLATAYDWSFTTGAEDLTPPGIVGRDPYPGEVDVLLRANVVITFTEELHPDSLDQEHFLLEGPYGAVPNTLSFDPATYAVTLDPDTRLLPTTLYSVTVTGDTTDWAGNPLGLDDTWTFVTQVEPPMNIYLGDIHNHTSYSDGSGTPAEALAAGYAAGFDFMAISDHSYAIDDGEWLDTLDAVNAATASDFVALRGFEYTQGAEGHINVFNTVRHAVRTDTGCSYCDYTPNLEAGVTVMGFYEWAVITGTVGIDEAGTVMQFNHPGWINFNDWTYHPEVSGIARLEEVGNGNGTSYAFSEDEYIRSLDYGWRVGATNNADTHTAYWGTNTDHRTGVLMTGLTKADLLEALQERRTYATEDRNFELKMKANGAWMGSEIANSGSILFEVEGADPDGEIPALVQIITDQGRVAIEFIPDTASFTWSPQLDITTGVHYFYIKVTQADGERIVSSPVWTMGSEDIAITDVVIQPSIPTIHSPSLLTARITNRNSEARTVSVSMDVDGVPLAPPVDVIVPGYLDAYANFSWQPVITGEVTVTAQLSGAPLGDNPDDNQGILNLSVTDEHLPLILIDAGHGNLNAAGREMRLFIDDLSAHQYNVLKNLDDLTPADLDPNVVRLLIITAPQYAYSSAELTAIGDYMAAGGNLWMLGLSDYTGKVPWAATVANRENDILAAIEGSTGAQINMRVNDDEIIDGDDNNGYVFGVLWSDFPSEMSTSIGLSVEALASWSLNSLRGRNANEPLTPATPDVQIVVQGDLDEGYTDDTWHNPFHTSNTDADGAGDAYIYNPTWVYPNPAPPDPLRVPMAAVTDLPGGAGRILLYGDSSDPFTSFAYTAGDGRQNELFNLESVMWLVGEQLQKSTIAEARAQATEDQPDNLDRLVWVEGDITAAYGEFFNVLYVQDETGGITVHAPAGDIDPTSYTRGTHVRVVGTVGIYNGDTEIEFFEAEMVQVITPTIDIPLPMPMSTYQASLEENQGWLGVITGTVTSVAGIDNIWVDDGSGAARVFLDGYNGDFSDITVNDLVRVVGLVSEDGDGHRIRVRNHGMHPEYPDDVEVLPNLSISKSAVVPGIINPGVVVTYTVELTNSGDTAAVGVVMTDSLPAGITFGGWVVQNGAVVSNNVITWAGDLPMDIQFVFTATVDYDASMYGQTITNSAEYSSDNAGSGSDSVGLELGTPGLVIEKSVATAHDPAEPLDPITYTLVVSNDGTTGAVGVHIWDILPDYVMGEDVDTAVDIQANRAYTITIPATLAPEVPLGTTITNSAQFQNGELSGEASASFNVLGGEPSLSIEKTVETANDPALPGDPITYTVVVRNDGTLEAENVHIWDVLPDYVLGLGIDVTATIEAGTAYTITIPAQVALDAPVGATLVNTAYFQWQEVSDEASASFTVSMARKIYLPYIMK